jgi:hypothetical protein
LVEVGAGTDVVLLFAEVCDETIADDEVLGGEAVCGGSGNDVERLVVLLAEVIAAIVSVTAAGTYGDHSAGTFCKDWPFRAHAAAKPVKKSVDS